MHYMREVLNSSSHLLREYLPSSKLFLNALYLTNQSVGLKTASLHLRQRDHCCQSVELPNQDFTLCFFSSFPFLILHLVLWTTSLPRQLSVSLKLMMLFEHNKYINKSIKTKWQKVESSWLGDRKMVSTSKHIKLLEVCRKNFFLWNSFPFLPNSIS